MELHKPADSNKTYEEEKAENKLRFEDEDFIELPQITKAMQTFLISAGIILVLSQFVVAVWKRRHYKSCALFTMMSMWSLPLLSCIKNGWWRFIVIWSIFTLSNCVVLKKTYNKPMSGSTPRSVYKWFYLIHKATYVVGMIAFLLIIATILGLNYLFGHTLPQWMDFTLILLFYGVYFGVLGSFIAEHCADKIADSIGHYTKEGISTKQLDKNLCAVCGNQLLVDVNEEVDIENTYRLFKLYKLTCGHVCHEFCIRSWCVVAKKRTCPYCNEDLDLNNQRMFTNLCDRPHLMCGPFLYWSRWLVAWQPLVLFLAKSIDLLVGLL